MNEYFTFTDLHNNKANLVLVSQRSNGVMVNDCMELNAHHISKIKLKVDLLLILLCIDFISDIMKRNRKQYMYLQFLHLI